MKYLYVSLSKPLKFGEWDEYDESKPMGWYRADLMLDNKNPWNKLKVLTMNEICEIKEELNRFAKSGGEE